MSFATSIARTTLGESPEEKVARTRHGGELVGEDLLVGNVVGERRVQFGVRGQGHDAGPQPGIGPDAFQEIAERVVCDAGGAAVAADIDETIAGDGFREGVGDPVQYRQIKRTGGLVEGLEIGLRERRAGIKGRGGKQAAH